jgi:predicted ABC-type ATPase
MIAGPNGSGKTTLYQNLSKQGVDFGTYLNADDIALNERATAGVAQERVRQARDAAMRAGDDYCWETVMSHHSHVHHLNEARALGYQVRLFYVALEDPEINSRRVLERVSSGGHDVPADRIKKRYYRSINNLSAAISVCDFGRIFDNSSKDAPFQLIASIDDRVLECNNDWFATPRWFIPALVDLNSY